MLITLLSLILGVARTYNLAPDKFHLNAVMDINIDDFKKVLF